MNEQDFAALSAGYALNALSVDDRRAFETALSQHPEWSHHLAADADTVAALAEGVAPVAPPRALRETLLARIAETPQTDADAHPVDTGAASEPEEDFAAAGPAPTSPVAAPSARSRARRGLFALAASVVLVLAIGIGTVVIGQQLTRPASVVALERIESAADAQTASVTLADGGEATAHWSLTAGEAVLVADGLPSIADGETFEAWFVRDETPVSAGTFEPSNGETVALLHGEMEPGDVIALTVEPDGGSPTGQPTSDPILAIATA
jgi:anti-sigma-K factor RskA